ncbi:GWxTD domain-containing protein [bacterium]|nr:MAG: GWxTD domain-containing protein [bacterium]
MEALLFEYLLRTAVFFRLAISSHLVFFTMRISVLALLIFLFVGNVAKSQSRFEYIDLLRTQRQSQVFYEHTFYASSDSLTEFVVNFRIENDFLSFVKNNDDSYSAEIRASVEVFDPKTDQIVRTAYWSGNKTVTSFQQTSAGNEFLEGFIKTELPQGDYVYQLKFQGANQRRESSSQKIPIHIGAKNPVWFYFLQSDKATENTLINYGGNAVFGKDFTLSLSTLLPVKSVLDINIYQVEIEQRDTTIIKSVFTKSFTAEDFKQGKAWNSTGSYINSLNLVDKSIPIATLSLSVPNSQFVNSTYLIEVKDGKNVVAKHVYQSFWYDMPLSLLNLDVSIAMLEIIMQKNQIAKLFSGNESERLLKFNKFWKDKDPTPNTEFNELMAEFYTRIDQAFKEFSTPRNPGFETDMGKVFIVYGPPEKKERSFPSSGLVIETWSYPKRVFQFQASSGFGDFQLIK